MANSQLRDPLVTSSPQPVQASSPIPRHLRFLSSHRVRSAVSVGLFLAGLLGIDIALNHFGMRQVKRGLIADDIYASISRTSEWSVLVLGDCRAIPYSSRVMSEGLGKPVLNAGISIIGMAHLLLSVEVILSHPAQKEVAVIIEDDLLSSDMAVMNKETELLSVWWPHLDAAHRDELARLMEITPNQQAKLHSGLWNFRGRGLELLRGLSREWSGKTGELRWTNENGFPGSAADMVGRREPFKDTVRQEFHPSPKATEILLLMLKSLKTAGVKPVLVLAPMHFLRSTEAVNQKVTSFAHDLSKQAGVPLINYLGNSRPWSNDDTLWWEPGHLNARGELFFSNQLAADLKKGLP